MPVPLHILHNKNRLKNIVSKQFGCSLNQPEKRDSVFGLAINNKFASVNNYTLYKKKPSQMQLSLVCFNVQLILCTTLGGLGEGTKVIYIESRVKCIVTRFNFYIFKKLN